MRGDEKRVVEAFKRHLETDGWSVTLEEDSIDLVARRGGETLIVEAKGRTTAPSTDVDTLYGQLLRGMDRGLDESMQYVVLVPSEFVATALRVPASVRQLLRIRVFAVDERGVVTEVADASC